MNQPRWIWHFGDYEIYHSLLLHARRQEMGCDYPTMWFTPTPYATVTFDKHFECAAAGEIVLHTNGIAYLLVDDVRYACEQPVAVSAGAHDISVRVTKPNGLPCIYVTGVCPSDGSWTATHMTSTRVPAGAVPCYPSLAQTPETFPFSYQRIVPVSTRMLDGGMLYDFGRETYARVILTGMNPDDPVQVIYGESEAEALDPINALLRETVCGQTQTTLRARAFRYLFISGGTALVAADYEYLPLPMRGKFSCDDARVNRVFDTAAYTFHLNSREFFLDGIKRDHWVWSGDAYQCYMINNYLFFDKEIARRTIIALRGKDPVEQHINTILDYSLYWIISLSDYYDTYADDAFIRLMYDKAVTLADFVFSRTDENGFLIGQTGDWVFVDWSEMDKTGAVCAEQMLAVRALEALARIAALSDRDGSAYAEKAAHMRAAIEHFYWNAEKGAYIDSYASGNNHVTRHANIFAILFGIADAEKTQSILENVLLNDAITAITTPYFEFYELDVFCRLGRLDFATQKIRDYWGGMLDAGATSIWEAFDPSLQGDAHYAMYGNRFGKSLCHAWGGGPIYLLGHYYLGLRPTAPGYAGYEVAPALGGLSEISGDVPTPQGDVHVEMNAERVTVCTTVPGGTLVLGGQKYPIPTDRPLTVTRSHNSAQ